jgi:hypothetical protein
MSTHIATSYQIVFSTKDREPVLRQDRRSELFRYIWEYITRQEEHHRKTTFQEEYRKLLVEAGIEFDERYLF